MRETVRAIIVNKRQQTFLVQHHERNPEDLGKWATVGGRRPEKPTANQRGGQQKSEGARFNPRTNFLQKRWVSYLQLQSKPKNLT